MAMSVVFGVILAALVGRLTGIQPALLGVGMAVGLAVWLVNQYVLWPAIDQTAAQAFTAWVLAVGHLLFGLVAAVLLGRVRFVKVNVDHHPDLNEAYRVSSSPTVPLFVSGHVAGSSLGAKPATTLERDLGLTGHGEQAEPAGGRTGRPRLGGGIQARWNGG